jgi:AraC-like DNA-binding protein
MSAGSKLDVDQKPVRRAKMRTCGPIPFVRANALSPFVGFLNDLGAPIDNLLQQARVPTSLLEDPEALLPIFSGYRFIELAARRERLEDIGVLAGQRASAFELGAYGAALWDSSTVYEYLRHGVQLIGEHSSGTRLWLEPEADALRVNQYLSGRESQGRCIGDLFTLVLTINTLRQFFGPTWSPGEVRLLAGTEALLGDQEVFGDAPLITGQRYSSFTVSRKLMCRPVPHQHAGASQRGLGPATESLPIATDFRTSVEQLIVSLLSDGYFGIQAVAEAAGMSPRTLQRRLADAGVTYADLVAASRCRIAKDWLEASDMTVAEIANSLGYTAASNFARAFRRQTGLSPAVYRRELKRKTA